MGTDTIELCSQEVCRPKVNNNRLETVTVVKGEWYRFIISNILPIVEGNNAIRLYGKERMCS